MPNILIVDDDYNLARTLAASLRKELGNSFWVEICSNGQDALIACTKKNFDLVISDFNMPGMTGLDLFKRLRVIVPNTVLVLITAYGSNHLQKEAELYADTYITKPFEPSILAEFIRHFIPSERINKVYSVLILEDDPYLRRLISKVLKNGNFIVSEASTIKEASSFLENNRFDVLISDIQVTDGQGTDLVRKYRDLLSLHGTTVIIATGESRYHHLEEELGIDIYLEKPVSVQDLVTIVQRWVKKKEETHP